MEPVRIRDARIEDLPAIVEICNSTAPSRVATADNTPLSPEEHAAWFRRHTPEHHPLTVMELGGQIVAWLSFQPFRGRPAYAHTAEVSVQVHNDFKGKGLSGKMLADALRRAPHAGIRNVVACILSHNTPSLQTFAKFGFKVWGELPGVAAIGKSEYSLTILGRRVAPYVM